MRKLLLTVTIVFALMAAIPAVSLGGKGSIGTQDTCAAVFGTEDAGACGSGDLVFLGPCIFVPGYGAGQWVYNRASGQQYIISCTGK